MAVVLGCIAFSGAATRLLAQNEPAGTTEPSVLIAQNPVVAELAPVDPAIAREVLIELQRITTGTRIPGSRAGARPTSAEVAQIAANPAFAQAEQHDPDATLVLLRWVNREIQIARRADE